jgi:uncharacterized protein
MAHLRRALEMIESGCPCHELAQQLDAFEETTAQAKKTIIEDLDHIGGAIGSRTRNRRRSLDAFQDIAK